MPARLLVVRRDDPVPDSGMSTDTGATTVSDDGTLGADHDGGGV
jgi:hypothetical protein